MADRPRDERGFRPPQAIIPRDHKDVHILSGGKKSNDREEVTRKSGLIPEPFGTYGDRVEYGTKSFVKNRGAYVFIHRPAAQKELDDAVKNLRSIVAGSLHVGTLSRLETDS